MLRVVEILIFIVILLSFYIVHQNQHIKELKRDITKTQKSYEMCIEDAEQALAVCKNQIEEVKKEVSIEQEVDKAFKIEGDPEMIEALGDREFNSLIEPVKEKICNKLCSTYLHIEPKEENSNERVETRETCYFDGIGWHLPASTYRMQ